VRRLGTRETLAAAGALVLVLAVCAASFHLRQASRPTRADDAPATAARLASEPELERARGESARQAVDAQPGTGDAAASASAAGEPALTTLELQVVRADGVARDTRAWLVAGYHRELPADLRAPPPGWAPVFAVADAEGVLRFPGLAPGPYRAALEVGELRLEQGVRVLAGQKLARLVLRLGSATIEGFVYDDAGAPAPGTLLQLCRPGYGRNPPPFECFARTDANGFYRLQEVGSGLQALGAHPDGSLATGGTQKECMVPFTGVVRVDFGASAAEGVLWRGVARNSAGEAVSGPGEIRIHDEGEGAVRTQPLRADGSFELRLRPGSHHLWLQPAGFFPAQVDLGVLEVPAQDLQRDLLVPGARLRLRLTPPAGWEGTPEPSVRARHEGVALQRLVPLADGSFVHDGLEPGEYVLAVGGLAFAETHAGEYPFTLASGSGELALDLLLEPLR